MPQCRAGTYPAPQTQGIYPVADTEEMTDFSVEVHLATGGAGVSVHVPGQKDQVKDHSGDNQGVLRQPGSY